MPTETYPTCDECKAEGRHFRAWDDRDLARHFATKHTPISPTERPAKIRAELLPIAGAERGLCAACGADTRVYRIPVQLVGHGPGQWTIVARFCRPCSVQFAGDLFGIGR